ncbi:hypothetical protein M405DRAFT_835854, partial [Rhizopogon salebrosus TDB-379]
MIPKTLCFKVMEGVWVLDHTMQILGGALHGRKYSITKVIRHLQFPRDHFHPSATP